MPKYQPFRAAPHWAGRDATRTAVLGRLHARALKAIEEQCGRYIEEMPNFSNMMIQDIVLKSGSLTYQERFLLITFFPMNQVSPVLVAEFLALPGKLRDQAAVDHALNLMGQIGVGEGKPYDSYVMDSKKWIHVAQPEAKGGDWKAACRVLLPIRRKYTC